jgi:CheY-like chemotaxis protein
MKSIFLVDDNNRGIIMNLIGELEANNYKVFFTDDIKSLIESISDNKYDALILDIMMPIPESWSMELKKASAFGNRTGVVLFNLIRKSFPTLPVLIYSAYSHDITNNQYTYSIRKPELPVVIIQKLGELLADKLE